MRSLLRNQSRGLRNVALVALVLAPFGLFIATNAGAKALVIAIFALMAAAMALVIALK